MTPTPYSASSRRSRARGRASTAPRIARWSSVVSSVVPALAFAYAGYERRWAGDDGFINTRVVKQLMDGNGFVFNAGERVEAVTSAGWVFVLWALGELGFEIDSVAWVTSLLLSFVGLASAGLAAALITRQSETYEGGSVVLPLGLMGYAAIPVAWDYETSLLENGLGLAYLGIAYWLMARVVGTELSRRKAAVAAFLGLAPLVRPDFALYGAPLILILVATQTSWRKRAIVALCGALPGGAFQIFRMGYFASLVPNTAIAKEAFEARWDQGFHYFQNTAGAYSLILPLSIAGLALVVTLAVLVHNGHRVAALVPAALAGSGALHILYVVRLGGDFMHGRMLLPGLFAIFASIGVVRVHRARWRELGVGSLAVAAMAGWAFHCARSLRPEMFAHEILDERRWWSETSEEPNPTHLAQYAKHPYYLGASALKGRFAEGCPAGLKSLGDDIGDVCKRVARPEPLDGRLADYVDQALLPLNPGVVAPQVVAVCAFRPLGISGRLMGLRVNLTDSFGLADPLAARMELPLRARPGHEKIFDVAWWAAKYTTPDATSDARVGVARRALGCGALRDLHDATHKPLTVSRFLSNLALSWSLHRVRVPADPQRAVDQFCKS